MSDLVYPELSFKIVGILFNVYNELGGGYQEKVYQKAIAIKLKEDGINFKEQLRCDLIFNDEKIGKYFLDFLVDDKIVLELKAGNKLFPRDYNQVKSYLTANNLKLGILTLFTRNGVINERILNSNISRNSN